MKIFKVLSVLAVAWGMSTALQAQNEYVKESRVVNKTQEPLNVTIEQTKTCYPVEQQASPTSLRGGLRQAMKRTEVTSNYKITQQLNPEERIEFQYKKPSGSDPRICFIETSISGKINGGEVFIYYIPRAGIYNINGSSRSGFSVDWAGIKEIR